MRPGRARATGDVYRCRVAADFAQPPSGDRRAAEGGFDRLHRVPPSAAAASEAAPQRATSEEKK
eukprot:CAMPEP_0170355928 /NCGR_PEP_ID=MMETSP0117_2-20130122/903_1 /TAXON_ID=400756 /ORGANISM="Durinskia baltica, Strain CSIRO CS-38" /LENGTH=63 /DNA_ID=CAMNT_0010609997 /DNA_START=249 /DNA_END=437 /DNA_ORIENTATION=-